MVSFPDLEKLKERLKTEVEGYEEIESGSLSKLSEDLDQEVTTINANCEVVEKYIDEDHDWTDTELVSVLEISFLFRVVIFRTKSLASSVESKGTREKVVDLIVAGHYESRNSSEESKYEDSTWVV